MSEEEVKVLKDLLDQMKEVGLFIGKYDAKQGNDKFMYGIQMVMEYLAYNVSYEYGEEFSDMFIKNMIESENKVKHKNKFKKLFKKKEVL